MPKPKKVELRFFVPESLANKVELLLLDPVYSRKKYGAMAKLGERLLTEWVEKVQKEGFHI